MTVGSTWRPPVARWDLKSRRAGRARACAREAVVPPKAWRVGRRAGTWGSARAAAVSAEGSARGAGGRGGRGRWPPGGGLGASPSASCSARLSPSPLGRFWGGGGGAGWVMRWLGGANKDARVFLCVCGGDTSTRVCVQMCSCAGACLRALRKRPGERRAWVLRAGLCRCAGRDCAAGRLLLFGLVPRASPGGAALSVSWGRWMPLTACSAALVLYVLLAWL